MPQRRRPALATSIPSGWRWVLRQLSRRLWVHTTLIGLLGVVAAMLAALVERYVPPWEVPSNIGDNSVFTLLQIMASSMLAVTTFSLSIMNAAYDASTNNVTPRATRLLMEDRITQNALSAFIGSFIFSIVGIIVLQTGAYGERGRFVMFVVTIAVIALVVISLLRWIDHLTRLGRVTDTSSRIEDTARQALDARLVHPYLGGLPLHAPKTEVPATAVPVMAAAIGNVQFLDMVALARCCEQHDCDAYVPAIPGTFAYTDTPLAWLHRADGQPLPESALTTCHACFTLGAERAFDQDPRFCLAVIGEIGARAVNDPGTAIDIIGRMARLLQRWADGCASPVAEPTLYPRIRVAPLTAAELFADAFTLISRNSAGMIEVQVRLQRTLHALARTGNADFRAAAREQAQLALERAESALVLEQEKLQLRRAAHDAA
ncbi:DUF2254 domain-containing protein [Kerstersia gyiorum]|uniref:Putative membrane protein n=1 Tax=Kerstersia gyiorum TaxID=206506 RepID=A0A4Q7MMC7_9BURK|nr:DUF2254 domain-containing protein [Kerstersia gyiorum]RZS69486.1 putative membrane protein [Kerstersia gyiorum]